MSYQTPLLEEPVKTQEMIDKKVAAIKAEYNALSPKEKRKLYFKTLKNEKLSKARRRNLTQNERSDLLREQWMNNDNYLINHAIEKVKKEITSAVNQGLNQL